MRSLPEKKLKIAFLAVAPLIVKFRFENYRYLLTHLLCLQIFEVLLSDKHSIVGQFGTGQFCTGQFGTKIIKRTIWHQHNKSGQFGTKIIKVDNLAPGQFGTRTIWHRTIWHQDNLAPNIWYVKIDLIVHFWQHFWQKFSFSYFYRIYFAKKLKDK